MDPPRAFPPGAPAPQMLPFGISDVSPASSMEGVTLRQIESSDLKELKCCHDEVLEISYPDDFYFKATHACEGISGWVAHVTTGEGKKMAGFVTVQLQDASDNRVAEEDLVDCRHMLMPNFWSKRKLIYILTMGVLPNFRKRGIATGLLNAVKRYSAGGHYSHVYLHTLASNAVAIQFYTVSQSQHNPSSSSRLPCPHHHYHHHHHHHHHHQRSGQCR